MVSLPDARPTSALTSSEARVPIEDAAFLRAVLEAIPLFVVRLDADLRITYINHLREGFSLDQVMGRPAWELVLPQDVAVMEQALQETLQTGRASRYIIRGAQLLHHGRHAFYEGHVVPMQGEDGRRGVCVVVTDISEQMARNAALQESEEKLRLAVEATGIGLWTWDIVEDRVDWNARMIEMTGSEPIPLSEYLVRFVHPEDRARIAAEAADAQRGAPHFVEHRVIRPDGQVRWFLPCGRVFKDDGGRVVRMIGGTLDITDRRKTDEHLRQAQRLDALGALTAGVAHNFNNMLAVILPALEMSLRGASDEQTPLLKDALHAAGRAGELVEQLMTFAGQRRGPAPRAHDLASLLERIVSMCRRTFGRQGRIEVSFDTGCPHVVCDPAAFEQVAVNLLINARDAVIEADRSAPSIRVELAQATSLPPDAPPGEPRNYVRLRVADNGVGMSEETKQHLFEPFYSTKRGGRGAGLGLATSYGIVRDHGGFISFESQAGAGTVVDVWLPVAQAQPLIEAPRPAPQPGGRTCRGTILVVDDEPVICRIVALLFTERGHEVHAANTGAAAVQLLDAGVRPSVVLLDRCMPGWPANKTIAELRRRDPRVPIVFFTGEEVAPDERAQIQDVLYKPLSSEALLHSVERWIAPHP